MGGTAPSTTLVGGQPIQIPNFGAQPTAPPPPAMPVPSSSKSGTMRGLPDLNALFTAGQPGPRPAGLGMQPNVRPPMPENVLQAWLARLAQRPETAEPGSIGEGSGPTAY